MILHDIFRAVSRFPRYISCYITESRLPLGQSGKKCWIRIQLDISKFEDFKNCHEKNLCNLKYIS